MKFNDGVALGIVWCVVCGTVTSGAGHHSHAATEVAAGMARDTEQWLGVDRDVPHEPHGHEPGVDTTPLGSVAFVAASTSSPSMWSNTRQIDGSVVMLPDPLERSF